MKNPLITNLISKLKLINFFFFIFGVNLIHIDSKAHFKGYYSSESEAKAKAKYLGCIGTHKLKEKWMPCKNEKQMHKYLREKV